EPQQREIPMTVPNRSSQRKPVGPDTLADYDRNGPPWSEILPEGWTLLKGGSWSEGRVRRPGATRDSDGSVGVLLRKDGAPLLLCDPNLPPPFAKGLVYPKSEVFHLLHPGAGNGHASPQNDPPREWPEPVPFLDGPAVTPFPVDLLSSWLAEWVVETS